MDKSLGCMVKEILACVLEIKAATGDQATLQELCDKIEFLEEKLCGPCIVPLAEEMTSTNSLVLEGDQTADYVAGTDIELTNDAGEVVGTAEVTSSLYNAEANTTTVQLANTQTTAELTAVKGTKTAFVSLAPTREAVKKEAVVAEKEAVVTRG